MDNGTDVLNDLDIISRVLNGHPNDFESLLVKYKEHVVKVVTAHVPYDQVEETAHDVFVRVYKSLPNYKSKGSFKGWLTSIAVRTCYDFWRKQYRSRELPIADLSQAHQQWIDLVLSNQSQKLFEENCGHREAHEVLEWALAKLSPEDRMVIELVYLQEKPVKEAARLLGWSAANVKVRSFRARQQMLKTLEGLAGR